MDAINPDFPEESFDAVIDKVRLLVLGVVSVAPEAVRASHSCRSVSSVQGTLDSILCGENSTANSAKMLSEISRCVPSPIWSQ